MLFKFETTANNTVNSSPVMLIPIDNNVDAEFEFCKMLQQFCIVNAPLKITN